MLFDRPIPNLMEDDLVTTVLLVNNLSPFPTIAACSPKFCAYRV